MRIKTSNDTIIHVNKSQRSITIEVVEFIADSAVLEEFEEDAKEIADRLEIIGNIYENKDILEVNHGTIR